MDKATQKFLQTNARPNKEELKRLFKHEDRWANERGALEAASKDPRLSKEQRYKLQEQISSSTLNTKSLVVDPKVAKEVEAKVESRILDAIKSGKIKAHDFKNDKLWQMTVEKQ